MRMARRTLRRAWVVVLGVLLVGANQLPCRGFDRAQSAAGDGPRSYDLVLVGTVTKLYPLAAPRQRRRWAVVVRVDGVTSGEFSGSTFTFDVHSPALAGLRVKRTYVVKANRAGEGYVVDESALAEVRARKGPSGKR